MELKIYFKGSPTQPVIFTAYEISWICGDDDCTHYTFDLYDEKNDLIRTIEVPKEMVMLVDLQY